MSELSARLYFHFCQNVDYEFTHYSTELKREVPGTRYVFTHWPDKEVRLMGVRIKTNELGLRGRSPHLERKRTMAMIGDSITLGWGVRNEDTFSELIAGQLHKDKIDIEVLNLGHGNYNSVQEVAFFESLFKKVNFDEAVLFYFINDAENIQKSNLPAFTMHFALISLVWSAYNRLPSEWTGQKSFKKYYKSLYSNGSEGWKASRRALLELKDFCRRHHVNLQLVLIPELHQLKKYPFQKEHRLIKSFLRKNQFRYLDLTDSFQDVSTPQKLWVAWDDAHPNKLGHRKIFQGSYEFIKQGVSEDEALK